MRVVRQASANGAHAVSVYAPGAPAEIWALVGVTDGAKLLAMWWWSKADHAVQRDPATCTVWAPAVEGRTPAEALLDDAAGVHPDKAARTIRGYMAELKAAGLASVEGRLVTLTPPSLAKPRQDQAKRRRKSAGENPPTVGESQPIDGEDPPGFGEISPLQLNPPIHPYPPSVPATPAAPDPDASGAGSPMQGSETAQGHPCKGEPSSEPEQPPKPRRRRSPAAGQAALDLGAEPEPPPIEAELLLEHARIREAAHEAHGEAMDALPGPKSKAGRSLRAGIRAALKKRGEDWCRAMLKWRHEDWLGDPAQLAFSGSSVWTRPSLEYAAKAMGQPARASPPSRAPRLSAPPPGEAPEYVPSFKPGSENDPCETF